MSRKKVKKRIDKQKLWLILLLGLALILRLGHWLVVRDDPFVAHLIMDSHEYDRWAQEIVGSDWLGSEIFFQPPLYPYFLASIYKIFGRNLDVVYLLQIFLAVGGCYALYRAGRKLANPKVGLAAAALAAAYGVFIFHDVQIVKESLAVTIVCFLLWVLVEARESQKIRIWLFAGMLCGVLSLLRENTLLVVPILFLLTYSPGEKMHLFLLKSGTLVLGVVIILTPVAFRNWWVGGQFLPTTFQGGPNFYIGNNPRANGTYQPIVPGKHIPHYERTEPTRIAEQVTGKPLTPLEVSNFWFKKSLSWAKRHPLDFIKLQLKKTQMFWSWYEWPDAVDYYYIKQTSWILHVPLIEFGCVFILAIIGLWLIKNRLRAFFPIFVFILAWMGTTVIFFLFSRYRLPAVPALILLAAVPFVETHEAWKKRRFLKAGILTFILVLAFTAPHLIGFKPRLDFVHYNLAVVYESQGQDEKAVEHYRQALSFNPDDFLSCVNLGNHAVQRQDWSEALSWYKKAADIEPNSDGVHCNLAGAYVALGRLEEAEAHFDQALKLNPKNRLALHNKAILLVKKGKLEEALQLNQEVLELAPDWTPALRFRARLDQLLKKK